MPNQTDGSNQTQVDQTQNANLAINIVAMHKWYGEFHVLKDINLSVTSGERIVICGPSGSGKSTMIRCINRLGRAPARGYYRRWRGAYQ